MKKVCQRQLKWRMFTRRKANLQPITEEERAAWVKDDDLYAFYKDYVDNESAFEVLNAQADLAAVQQKQAEQAQQEEESGLFGSLSRMILEHKNAGINFPQQNKL